MGESLGICQDRKESTAWRCVCVSVEVWVGAVGRCDLIYHRTTQIYLLKSLTVVGTERQWRHPTEVPRL